MPIFLHIPPVYNTLAATLIRQLKMMKRGVARFCAVGATWRIRLLNDPTTLAGTFTGASLSLRLLF